MITEKMIQKGFQKGIVRLIDSPHDDGVVCSIGNNWFYFGGDTAEGTTLAAYKEIVSEEDIVRHIFETLDDFPNCPELNDEYLYYEAVLDENGITAESSENMEKHWQNCISIQIQSNCNGTYDVLMATEGNSGDHYTSLTAQQAGEHLTELIRMLEEAASGTTYCGEHCPYLCICQEDYDDEPMAFCTFLGGRKFIASMDAIRDDGYECISVERRKDNDRKSK